MMCVCAQARHSTQPANTLLAIPLQPSIWHGYLQAQPWYKPNRRDFVVSGIGALFGGAAMYLYDTCEWKKFP